MGMREVGGGGSDEVVLVDPLLDVTSFSLFPRFNHSSSSSSSSSTTTVNNPNSSIIKSLTTHLTHLNARVLSSPDKLSKQAKTILEGSMDHLESNKTDVAYAESENKPRERRPALGIKRAKFSIKPIPNQPAVIVKSSIDLDKLSDPDEYFDAIERMERAEMEVRRLRGEPLVDLNQNRTSLALRRRRPSLLGRSSTYTHRPYPSIMSNADEKLLSSQETFDSNIRSPTRNDVLSDANVINNSPSVRLSDSKSMKTSAVSELDELLSYNFAGLDADGVQNVLKEKLKIKHIGKDVLPDWRVPLRGSLISSSALRVSRRDQVSPPKSKSPLASISLLNRHIAKCTPSKDLFSPLHTNLSPAKAADLIREPEQRADQAGKSDEVDTDLVSSRGHVSPAESQSPLASISLLNGHLAKLTPSKDPLSPLHIDLSPAKEPEMRVDLAGQSDELCDFRRSQTREEVNITLSGGNPFVSAAMDVDPIGDPKEREDVSGKCVKIGNTMDSCEVGRSLGHEEESIAEPGVNSDVLAAKDVGPTGELDEQEDEMVATQELARQLYFEGLHMENLSSNGVEKDGTVEPTNTGNISVEEPTKHQEAPSEAVVSEEPVKKGRKSKKSQSDALVSGETRSRKRKIEGAQPGVSKDVQQRRFSLYQAGMRWEAGVRRSTRIRMRPLQYWKGERFLYGRVHQSLVTVIGVKYASPSKDSEGVKVKSFVSDEHKDLVNLASLH